MPFRLPLRSGRFGISAGLATIAVSPVGAIVLAYVTYLLCAAIPQNYYVLVLHEQDFMAGSAALFGFYSLACLAFLAGFLIVDRALAIYRPISAASEPAPVERSRFYYPYFLAAGIALNLYSLAIILRNTPGVFDLITSARGEELKASIDTTGGFTQAQPLLIGMIWLAIGKHMARFPNLRSKKALLSLLLIAVSMMLSIALSIIKLARYEIMPLLFGSAIVAFISLQRAGKLRLGPLLIKAAIFGAAIGFVFVGFTLLRGARDDSEVSSGIMGYGPAAFNHLAAMLEGRLVFPYRGSGAYVLSFLSFIPFLHSVIDVQAQLHLPDLSLVLSSEFVATKNSGLNGDYIWLTAPGYYYSDLGDAVHLLLAGMGAWSGLLWHQIRRGNAFALVMYPFLLATVMMWFSFSMFTRPQLVTFLAVGAVAWLADRLLAPRTVAQVVPVSVPAESVMTPQPSSSGRSRRSGSTPVPVPYYFQYKAPGAAKPAPLKTVRKGIGWLWDWLLRLIGWDG